MVMQERLEQKLERFQARRAASGCGTKVLQLGLVHLTSLGLRRTASNLPPIISAQGLSKRYGVAPLFQGISFMVSEGDRIGIIGPNGSGKSTLLAILNGRVSPDSGDVAIRKGTRVSCVLKISEFAPGETIRTVIERTLDQAKIPESERLSRIAEILGRAGFTDLDADAVRRLAQASGDCRGTGAEAGYFASGRTDQPPGSRWYQVARNRIAGCGVRERDSEP